jgi:hypothetical protein
MREKRVERYLRQATRNALLFGEGFISTTWDPQEGNEIAFDPEMGSSKEGDIVYAVHESVDVIRDPNLKNFNQRTWLAVRTYENKYEIAEKYPEYYDEIVAQQSGISAKNHYLAGQFLDRSNDTDLIPLITFYHSKTGLLPDGRQMQMLVDGTVLYDTILLYTHLPVHRIVPSEHVSTPMGSSVAFDLLPLQEMLDAHYTTILSINENYSIPKVLLPIGCEVNVDSLSQGFQSISYNKIAGEPKIMEMPTAPAGLFQALDLIVKEMETISGVNSVTRGNPEASLKSGSALALVQSMAIQFNAPLQQSYIQLLEDVGTATLNVLKDYAESPRIIQIAGKNHKGILQQSFSKDDLDTISRVQVQVGNPLAKTVSGRLSIAQDLLQNQIIKTSDEYLMVLETGQLEPLTQGQTGELLALKTENEMLLDGQQVPVLFTDNHVLHIQEHTCIASDPTIRMDPSRFGILAQHIMEHINNLSDPAYQSYRTLIGQPSLQPPQMPAPNGPPNTLPAAGQMGASDIQNKANEISPPQNPAMNNERASLAQPV